MSHRHNTYELITPLLGICIYFKYVNKFDAFGLTTIDLVLTNDKDDLADVDERQNSHGRGVVRSGPMCLSLSTYIGTTVFGPICTCSGWRLSITEVIRNVSFWATAMFVCWTSGKSTEDNSCKLASLLYRALCLFPAACTKRPQIWNNTII